MRLWEIALPTVTNNGASYDQALAQWEAGALATAGGYTKRPDGEGAWRDPSTGTIYRDVMRPYRVACDAGTFRRLLASAFVLFPDQIAIFTADLGEATIYSREG